jgi:monothiol glutaredoxin
MNETHQRIDDLVKSNDVVLFMKGSPMFPQCRFSSSAIQILKAIGVGPQSMRTVNVLEDDAIHQSIKEYSNWPAIPILYFKGELIGGPDIMLKLYQSGDLKHLLASSTSSASHALQVGAALVGVVKIALEGNLFRDDKRLNITIDAESFTNELAAFCLSSVQAAIRLHGTSNELLSGFEDQIAKEFSKTVNEIYALRSSHYLEADREQYPKVLNLKTPGDLLSLSFAEDTISQLLIGQVLNSHWKGQFLGAVALLKKTGFFHG